ncbi:MAG: class I SAM-dependent methyltransferase [Planctomycetes bacterium]|nr:class I SAM-dependent methyltransferase [Planctomycetota bacterium]
MARFILDLEPEGPIVECGCFRGGSTAKLSLLAERTGRRLYVCDSFSGLPEAKDPADGVLMSLGEGPSYCLQPGAYAATLDEVRQNVRRFGCIEVCEFLPGLFHESLPDLRVNPACVFTDVDYVSSARDCLRYLWPRLVPGGCWFTHEAMFHNYVSGIMDPKWWHNTLQECPPLMMGAGSGLSELAQSLAYFQKGGGRSTSDLQWPS